MHFSHRREEELLSGSEVTIVVAKRFAVAQSSLFAPVELGLS